MKDLFGNEKESLNRPAWNSTENFEAYKHKHCIERGRFILKEDYYTKSKRTNHGIM